MKILVSAGFLAGAVIAAPAQGQDARPLEFIDIFSLEVAADPQISPDGSAVVYERRSNSIMTDQTGSALWVVDYDGDGHRPLLAGDRKSVV